jgi:mannose-1-phosphate guanylyltransferase
MLILPSDYLISNNKEFINIIKSLAEAGDNLVTIGIEPIRTETGYCFITNNQNYSLKNPMKLINLLKKDLKKVLVFIKSGNYTWNILMFVWKVKTIKKISKNICLNLIRH